jgi:hypothetical protein
MNIFEELLWPQFVKLERVRKLPLNEQVKEYNLYIHNLSISRQNYLMSLQNWLSDQPKKGPLITEDSTYVPVISGFLLQEDLFNLLQEDGSKIYITI